MTSQHDHSKHAVGRDWCKNVLPKLWTFQTVYLWRKNLFPSQFIFFRIFVDKNIKITKKNILFFISRTVAAVSGYLCCCHVIRQVFLVFRRRHKWIESSGHRRRRGQKTTVWSQKMPVLRNLRHIRSQRWPGVPGRLPKSGLATLLPPAADTVSASYTQLHGS